MNRNKRGAERIINSVPRLFYVLFIGGSSIPADPYSMSSSSSIPAGPYPMSSSSSIPAGPYPMSSSSFIRQLSLRIQHLQESLCCHIPGVVLSEDACFSVEKALHGILPALGFCLAQFPFNYFCVCNKLSVSQFIC